MSSIYEYLPESAKGFLSMNIPKVAGNVNNILLSAITRERVVMNKEVTTHVLESGSYVSDHVVEQPVTIYVDGFVAIKESKPILEVIASSIGNQFPGLHINTVYSVIGLIHKTAGVYSIGRNDWVANIKKKIDDISYKAKEYNKHFEDIVNYFLSATTNKVMDTFKLFKKISDDRIPLNYTSQYGVFENLFITQIEAVTDTETGRFSSKVSLKLEQLKFVQSVYAPADENLLGRIKNQFSNLENKGTMKLEPIPVPDYPDVVEALEK